MVGEHERVPVRVELSWTGPVPAFVVRPPVSVLTIAFYDVQSGEPIWILVSNSFSQAHGEVVGGVAQEAAGSEGVSEQSDADLTREAGAVVSSFTYGVVPNCFQQMVPPAGGARPLEDSSQYVLVINGKQETRLAFQVKS